MQNKGDSYIKELHRVETKEPKQTGQTTLEV